MTRRLVASYLLLTAIVLALLEIPLGTTFTRLQRTDLLGRVEVDAVTVTGAVQEILLRHTPDRLAGLAADYRAHSHDGRLLVVGPDGTVLADSDGATGQRDAGSNRPEVAAALAGRVVDGRRHSASLGHDLVYVARPVRLDGHIVAAVRVTYPSSVIDARVRRTWLALAAAALAVLVVVGLLGRWLALAVSEPLERLRAAAGRLGDGDLSARAPIPFGPAEVRELATSFNETAERLGTALQREREFAGDASHQLRTPLSVVRMRLEMLEGQVAEAAEEDLEVATAEVDRLTRVVSDLLLLARSQDQVELVAVDLAALAGDRLAAWSPVAHELGVTLELTGEAVPVLAAPGSVEQVLDNLLANAIEVSTAGGTVTIDLDGATIHVVDSGPGLPREDRERAFDRTWRSDRGPSRLGGSGLGLTICRRLVDASGGRIRLDAAVGGGIDAVVDCRPM